MNVTAHDMEHEAFEALCRLSNSSDWFMQVARQQQLADEFLTKQTDDLQRMSALVSQGLRLQVQALHTYVLVKVRLNLCIYIRD